MSVQYLRAVAALMVVFHHARNPFPGFYDPVSSFAAGQAGVDVFFVISGFIMYSSALSLSAPQFLIRRLIRIAPLYWLATILLFLKVHQGHMVLPADIWSDLLKSLLFIPHYSITEPNEIYPTLIAGWTLNFEMFFYFIFALGLFLRLPLQTASIVILTLVSLGSVIGSYSPIWLTYTDSIMFEFLMGAYIARYRHLFAHRCLILLLPIGFTAIILSGHIPLPRVLIWGLPAAAIIIGALTCEKIGLLPTMPHLGKLGDASFSIYLFQGFALTVARAAVRLGLHGPLQFLVILTASLIGSVILGTAAYELCERPINRYLSRRRPTGRVEVQAAP